MIGPTNYWLGLTGVFLIISEFVYDHADRPWVLATGGLLVAVPMAKGLEFVFPKKPPPKKIAPMSSTEYQRLYDHDLMPERFWPEEIPKLQEKYIKGEVTLEYFEDALDDMMGITWLETSNIPLPREEDEW